MLARSSRVALLFAALSVLSFLAIGCSDSGAPGDVTGTSEDALDANEAPAFSFFVGKGLTTFQAAGIVGNLVQESNVDPTAVQSGGPGRGIAQWSVGGRWDSDGGDNAVAYASEQKMSVDSLTLQLEFIWYELTNFSSYGLGRLRATTNVTEATVAFQDDFEGCGTCDESNRVAYAEAALAAYGSISYAASYVSQSFPLATTTLKMTAGQIIPSSLTMKNTGTKNWGSSTRLGTTGPRDRASAFADSTWVSSSRLDAVSGTVAPGGDYKFQFDLRAPEKPGLYDEHFGLVEDGVAWFGDPGQGGPSDTQIEVKIQVIASDGGTVGGDEDGGLEAPQPGAQPGDPSGSSADGSSADGADSGGCSTSPKHEGTSGAWLMAAMTMMVLSRRKSSKRKRAA